MTTKAKGNYKKRKGRLLEKEDGTDFKKFEPLSRAEKVLIKQFRKENPSFIGDCAPKNPTSSNKIRAEFLRHLVLNGHHLSRGIKCEIYVEGAWIDGDVDLSFQTIEMPFSLINCQIVGRSHTKWDQAIRSLSQRKPSYLGVC